MTSYDKTALVWGIKSYGNEIKATVIHQLITLSSETEWLLENSHKEDSTSLYRHVFWKC